MARTDWSDALSRSSFFLSLPSTSLSLFSFSLFSHTSRMEGSIAQMMLMRPPLLTEKNILRLKKHFLCEQAYLF
jgi:hypothetical protein